MQTRKILIRLLHSQANMGGKGTVLEVDRDLGLSWVKLGVAEVFATSYQPYIPYEPIYEKREAEKPIAEKQKKIKIPEAIGIKKEKELLNELQNSNRASSRTNKRGGRKKPLKG